MINHIKRIVNYFMPVLVILQVPHIAAGQADTISIPGKFGYFSEHVLQEKVFVHTDKPCYYAGEILWFKIYDVDAAFHKPMDISKVAYVELLNKENSPVLQAKVALKNGSGDGSFYLPVSVVSGNYKLRAYTNWMKNFSPDFFFEKDIRIVNTLKATAQESIVKKSSFDARFFPEGGDMVAGIPCKVGFRVVDRNGKGVEFSGAVVDDNNLVVASFRPLKFGIGNFLMTPVAGHTYKAIIKPEGVDSIVKELPLVHQQGFTMSLTDNNNGTLTVKIRSRMNESGFFQQHVYLFVHTRQVVKLAESILLEDGKADYTFSKNIPGEGISHFTLFNGNQQPVCERLYFTKPTQRLGIEVKSSAKSLSVRQKVKVEILSGNPEGNPEPADLSVAVYKLDSLQPVDPCNIFSYLWLSSDLSGSVESPAYYFNNTGPEVDEAMDNLMLTHGWRRFRWDEVLQNKTPLFEFLPEYEGHVICGKITDTRTNLPAGNVRSFLSVPGSSFRFYTSTTNAAGQLRFYTHNFYKSGQIIVLTGCGSDSTYKLEINQPFASSFSTLSFPEFQIPSRLQEEILGHSIGMQVQNIYAGKTLNRFREVRHDSLAFYGIPDRSYYLDDYTRFGTLEEVIREYVEGVFLHKKKNKFYIQVVDEQHHVPFDADPLVLFDGIPVCDFNRIMDYDPLKMKKIEIINHKYYLGDLEFSGIVCFTTYKGSFDDLKIPSSSVILDYEGLQKQREFYSPVYETGKQALSRVPDFRNLLFWSPDTVTNATGKAEASFYTSDQPGVYVIMVQGISANGNAGSQVVTFEVKSSKAGLK